MSTDISRRALIAGAAGGLAMTATEALAAPDAPQHKFGYCLNTSTVRDKDGKSRPVTELVEIAARAGYQAVEPWISELTEYTKAGGSLKELGKRIADAGLAVPDAIGFAEWVVENPERRKAGLEQAKRDMEWVAEVGSPRIAAPPVGATGGTSKRDDPKFTQPVVDLRDPRLDRVVPGLLCDVDEFGDRPRLAVLVAHSAGVQAEAEGGLCGLHGLTPGGRGGDGRSAGCGGEPRAA